MKIEPPKRIKDLPPYLFVEIDNKKRHLKEQGFDLIDLGIGDPDLPTPRFIIDRMKEEIYKPENHRYPLQEGVSAFRKQIAIWFKARFGVELDPTTEILATIGSKDGITHLPLALTEPDDIVLIPEPGYPAYQAATIIANARPYLMPLEEKNGFLPELEAIPKDIRHKAKFMFLNYPNNPTAAIATEEFFKKAVEFARENNIIIAHDAAYTEVYFETKPISILNIEGAKDIAIEFHSLSKTFNMTGWRIGFAVGNKDIISLLAKIKSNMDSGQFNAIQWAATEALANYEHLEVRSLLDTYRDRRDTLVDGLKTLGFRLEKPKATFYVWCKCPEGYDSLSFCNRVLQEAHVVLVPGIGFGPSGKDYFRAAITVDKSRLEEAVERIRKII